MTRLCLTIGISLVGLVTTVAHSQTLPTDVADKKSKCAMIGSLYHKLGNGDSVASARGFAQRNGYSAQQTTDFLSALIQGDKDSNAAGDVLEKRYGKATSPEQIAEVNALSQKPTRVWKPMAAECLL